MRILVIEDNPTNLELMTYLLNASGHSITTATNGEEGLSAALESVPDLILCDLAMPVLDGFGVARRLKSDPRLDGIPLIAVTASAMVGDRDKVIASGFDGYISKPITPETFAGDVERYFPKPGSP
jgi:CheY-like chemotaxis protein